MSSAVSRGPVSVHKVRWQRGALLVLGAALVGVLCLVFRKSPERGANPGQTSEEQTASAESLATGSSRLAVSVSLPGPELPAAGATRLDSLKALVDRDPASALTKIQSIVPEQEAVAQKLVALEVKALVKLGRIGAARSRAGVYYQRWPDGPEVAALESLTGLHPTPSRADQD
jgi:hypothetical protein